MRAPGLYRALVRALPYTAGPLQAHAQGIGEEKKQRYASILRRHRALGGALILFGASGVTDHFTYGAARRGVPVAAGTAFRLASVSKLVTAAGVMAMAQKGIVDLNADADAFLPYSLRHPGAPDRPVTLRMLLTHTAGIRDGSAYTNSIASPRDAGELLRGDSNTAHIPGEKCEYSNFGVGLAGCVLEGMTGTAFEPLMQEHLFRPLGIRAGYYPHRVSAPLADARRVLKPLGNPAFDAAARQAAAPAGWDEPDLQRHYLLAHGNCCMDAQGLARLGAALLTPGFFAEETLEAMFAPHASLAHRDPALTQGVGVFILRDASVGPRALHGHQGMAYGAVHMLFLDREQGRGIVSLTTGVSLARRHIMADVNVELLREWQRDG